MAQEWIKAAEASRLLKPLFGTEYGARMAICKRAHAEMIRAREDALRYELFDVVFRHAEVKPEQLRRSRKRCDLLRALSRRRDGEEQNQEERSQHGRDYTCCPCYPCNP